MSDQKPLPMKLQKWLEQPGSVLTTGDRAFVEEVRTYARLGVGFGFMQQVIEWVWQEWAAQYGLQGSSWGPEYFGARIAELETKYKYLMQAAHKSDTANATQLEIVRDDLAVQKRQNAALAERVAAQSELLSKRAEVADG